MRTDIRCKILEAMVPVFKLVPKYSDLTGFEIREIDFEDYAIPIFGKDIPEIGIVHGEGAYIKLKNSEPLQMIADIASEMRW